MRNQDTTFIYGLFDPRNYQLRYIGKSDNPQKRLRQHIVDCNQNKYRNRYVYNWIRQLLNEGLEPSVEILEEVLLESWEEVERAWIADCRKFGLNLTNTTDGGEGLKNPSFEVRTRLGWMKGKKQPNDFGLKMSKLLKGRVSPMRGRYHTEEAKEKISKASMGREKSKEEREKLSKNNIWRGIGFMKGKIFSDEHKQRISKSHLGIKNPMYGVVQSTETIQKRIEKLRGKRRSQEFKDQISARQKGKEFTEEHKTKLREAWRKRKDKYGYSGRKKEAE